MHIILNFVTLSELQSFSEYYLAFLKIVEKNHCSFSAVVSKPICRPMYHEALKNTILKVETHMLGTQFAYVLLKSATLAEATTF